MGTGSSSMRGRACKSDSRDKLETKKHQKHSQDEQDVRIFVIESSDHKFFAIGAFKGEGFKYFPQNFASTETSDPHLSAKIAFLQTEAPELLGDMDYWID